MKTILDAAADGGRFNTLVQCLNLAGLADQLRQPGPFTLFAPDDDAFEKLLPQSMDRLLQAPQGLLKQVLLYHLLVGRITSAAAARLDFARTLQGDRLQLRVVDGRLMVDNAYVTRADIACSNGTIHAIDSVLVPEKLMNELVRAA